MKIASLIRLTAAALPIAIGGCANGLSDLRMTLGDASWTAEQLADTPYERGKQHFAAGRFGLAVKHFQIAAAQDPESIDALNGLAAAYDQLHRFDQAERFYRRALNLDQNSPQTLNNLGYSYLLQRRYDLALSYLREAQALDPSNPQVAYNLQQAEAGLDLGSRDFVASPIEPEGFDQLASASRSAMLRGDGGESRVEQETTFATVVHIRALVARGDTWVERTKPAVQTLITRPRPEILLAVRGAGVAPELANFQADSAQSVWSRRPTPWETTHALLADAVVEPSPDNAESQARPAAVEQEIAGAAGQERVADERVLAAPAESTATAEEPLPEAEIVVQALAEAPEGEAPAAPPSSDEMPVVEVSNGTGRLRMALRIGGYLETQGIAISRLTNADNYRHQETTIYYRDGWLEEARKVAAALPAGTDLEAAQDQSSDIRIRLGGNLLNFDRELFYADSKSSSEPTG